MFSVLCLNILICFFYRCYCKNNKKWKRVLVRQSIPSKWKKLVFLSPKTMQNILKVQLLLRFPWKEAQRLCCKTQNAITGKTGTTITASCDLIFLSLTIIKPSLGQGCLDFSRSWLRPCVLTSFSNFTYKSLFFGHPTPSSAFFLNELTLSMSDYNPSVCPTCVPSHTWKQSQGHQDIWDLN